MKNIDLPIQKVIRVDSASVHAVLRTVMLQAGFSYNKCIFYNKIISSIYINVDAQVVILVVNNEDNFPLNKELSYSFLQKFVESTSDKVLDKKVKKELLNIINFWENKKSSRGSRFPRPF